MKCPTCGNEITELECEMIERSLSTLYIDTKDVYLTQRRIGATTENIVYLCPECKTIIAYTRHHANLLLLGDKIKETMCPFCFTKDKVSHYEYNVDFVPNGVDTQKLHKIGYYSVVCTRCGLFVYAIGSDGIE